MYSVLECSLYDHGFRELWRRGKPKTHQHIRWRESGVLRDVLTHADVALTKAFQEADCGDMLTTFPRIITYKNMVEVFEEMYRAPDLEIPF
jgi:hypothetical protein